MRRAPAVSLLLALLFTLLGGTVVTAADPEVSSRRPVPAALDELRIDQPVGSPAVGRPSVMDASLLSATGIRQVVVRLSEASVGEVAAAGAGAASQRRALGAVTAQQDRFVGDADATVVGRTEIALNAVVLEVDAGRLDELAADPAVISISPVIDYQLALSETVPHIGATAVHDDPGFDGSGVTVAVLDSGIDYTHAAFGGVGSAEAYDAAYGADTGDPANKDMPDWAAISAGTNIVGGFDFVGEVWPLGRLAPDPDPIDCGGKDINPDLGGPDVDCEGGHGTHVADIIGGIKGVAPGVDLHAVKVCSAVSTSCSGVALLLGMDYALDPNADGNTADHVDVINMSLGSDYGQAFDDDLSQAVDVATEVGVLTVAAAGNGADKPYVSGTPAAAPTALSVAQTAVPSALLPLLDVTSPAEIAGLYPMTFQAWSQSLEDHGAIIDADFQYADGAGDNLDGCEAFAPGSLTGLVVLVDRGTCDFTLKIANIAAGGAEAGIIGLIAPGEPFGGGLGECPDDLCSSIPGFMIGQAAAEALKSAEPDPGAVVTLDPADGLPLIGTVVGSSSRGPTMLTNIIKPEIGAPGASISAEAGTATETAPFGGTSGATPMVAGSAALLLEGFSERSPLEIKSLLMNYAETEIWNGAPDAPINAELAAIQRIGAGEVRVDRSVAGGDFAAWDSAAPSASLSFGFVDASEASTVLTREVTVHNYGLTGEVLDITPSFRFQDDIDNGAVTVDAPATVTIAAGEDATFDVTLTIDGAALRDWIANSGGDGANPAPLNLLEYDGYIDLTSDDTDSLHLPWHVLPRLSGDTTAADDNVTITGEFEGFPSGDTVLTNAGVGLSAIDGYSWIGESPVLPTGQPGAGLPTVDLRYAGVQTIQVPDSFCESEFLLLLAVNTWERQTHANAPSAFEWDIDTDADGDADWAVFNLDLAGNLTDGRNAVIAQSIADPDDSSVFFLTDHATNSGNTVLTICGEQIGLTADDLGTPLSADLLAVDAYFTGRVTDVITGMQFAPLGERYFPVIGEDGFGSGDVPAAGSGGSATLTVLDFGPNGTNPGELGVLLFTDGARVNDADEVFKSGAPQEHEAIALEVSVDLPFEDIETSSFVDDIVWAFENGITSGCSTHPLLFCPNDPVTRGQMASFLDRALDLPSTATDFFTDDETSTHEAAINRVAEAGITMGCTATTFCPNAPVTREQMASFLDRALDLPTTATDFFTDDETSTHEAAINRVASAGITTGCTATTYCPKAVVTRGQMAAFLHRALGD
ncbi:MAG TPA: S8 family serine peptidase [Candidatus Limnocylindrales bacterium]|nr:S8 family serine peptidase [Candidatus Limnocylindrales bacterium]